MKKIYGVMFIITAAIIAGGLSLISSGKAAMGPVGQAKNHIPICSPGGHDTARCHAHVIVDDKSKPQASTLPTGYGPAQFQAAYGLTGISSSTIIGIVDAYNHPYIQNDLDVYSSAFGISSLPVCSGPIATSAVPCFQKVDQNGGTNYPQTNAGWALEIALDVEAAHAVCPTCKILLVEANSNSFTNLLTAENKAADLGAKVISNSWGANEFSGETEYDSYFNKPGVAITFSSGDSGYGVEYPAASQYVTAVGGTTLSSSGSETAWSGAGSGCSAYEPKPSFQSDPGCANRTVADVSADADPITGAAVYSSVRLQGRKGWFQVGGTSLASPLIAGVYALAGGVTGQGNAVPYVQGKSSNIHDILTGSNGSCGDSYLCTAKVGYDGPTGLGTPNGIGAF